jgi:hypothetical protein
MKVKLKGKNIVFLIAILLIGTSIIPTISGVNYISTNSNGNITITVEKINDITSINYKIKEFTSRTTIIDGDEYSIISLSDESNIMEKDKPELPNICRSIIIPDNLKMEVRIIHSQYQEYDNINVIPSKGNLLRSVNPDDIPYEFDEIYNEDKWFPEKIVSLRDPYIVHDFRGQVIEINPFHYNSVQEKLRFYNDITIEIYPIGLDSINCIDRETYPSEIDADFLQIYSRHFINSENFFNSRYEPVAEIGNMLIITYDSFWDAMLPFVQWKNMKGIPTEMVNVSTIGDAIAIDTYVENYYNDNGLTFLLLVGDAAQVPTLTAGSSASDPSYSYIVGSDHYPDIFVGRFSAQNLDQLETQIERSIEYERDPQIDAEWYQKGTGIASSQGPGDDGEMDYEHIRNIRNKLLNYNYTMVDEFYDGSQGGEDELGNPSATMVSEAINDGRSITNYCGHGSWQSWGSSGFSVSNINSLINDNMLPYVISVACNNGQFDDYDACFSEAWLRATNDGEPTGAIVSTGSSKSMSWNPPMDAQDEMNDFVVESYPDNVIHTFGAIHANGCMHMNDGYGSLGESETDCWHIFGDPSIQIRTATPTEMTVIHEPFIKVDGTSFEVDIQGVKGALCAISYDNKLLGYGYSDETGHAVINFNEPWPLLDGIPALYVSAYNKIPYNNLFYPPIDPPAIEGPITGKPEKEYEYTVVTTDPEGNPIYYILDWGDGTRSDWLGPYNSGEPVVVSHTWSEVGHYNIRVGAKTVEGAGSKWSEPFSLEIEFPLVGIGGIKSGFFKIKATIENIGISEADDISWKISLDGGLILLGKETTGEINTILAGEEELITSNTVIGFGPTQVSVKVNIPEGSTERKQGGYILLFFIKVNPGGS